MSNETTLGYPWHKINPGTDERIVKLRSGTSVTDPFEATDNLQDLDLPCAWTNLKSGLTVVALATVRNHNGYDAVVGVRYYVLAGDEATNVSADVAAHADVPADLFVPDGGSDLAVHMSEISEERAKFASRARGALLEWVQTR
ncbi:hypothetical protein [Demequina sp. NBRC 110055]|uniref:hypothetical protein n=1 Tax=Demequina sp. NBRC 110055 TaxID=1570344 RepID=UPI000A01DE88|nr:hypothetical protein [Demequina sp. NBRC 110055]